MVLERYYALVATGMHREDALRRARAEAEQVGARCLNCEAWSSAWRVGDQCPHCANGYEREARPNPNKTLVSL